MNVTSNKINYVIVDSSFPMLENSLKQISNDIKNVYPSKVEQYKLVALKTDFMKLEKSRQCFQGEFSKKSIFFMLGGTFCNLNENIFLDSLKRVMRKGDVFVVGVGLFNAHIKTTDSYNNQPIYDMLTSPLSKLGYEIISQELEVEWVEGRKDSWSVIEKAKTMLMKVNIKTAENKYKEIILQSASRYKYDELKEHIENHKFLLKDEAYNHDKDFMYLAFEYQGE